MGVRASNSLMDGMFGHHKNHFVVDHDSNPDQRMMAHPFSPNDKVYKY